MAPAAAGNCITNPWKLLVVVWPTAKQVLLLGQTMPLREPAKVCVAVPGLPFVTGTNSLLNPLESSPTAMQLVLLVQPMPLSWDVPLAPAALPGAPLVIGATPPSPTSVPAPVPTASPTGLLGQVMPRSVEVFVTGVTVGVPATPLVIGTDTTTPFVPFVPTARQEVALGQAMPLSCVVPVTPAAVPGVTILPASV